jgi:hypothetical protein
MSHDFALSLDERRALALTDVTRAGATLAVADEEGRCSELHVQAVEPDALTALVGAARLRPGARVTARAPRDGSVTALVLTVEELHDRGGRRAEARLRLVEHRDLGDERRDRRVGYDAPGTLAVVDGFSGDDGRAHAVRVVGVSVSAVELLVSRGLAPGETVDVAFADDIGAPIRARCRVVRVERAPYGRLRFVAAIVAIGELDALRLARAVASGGERGPAPEPPLRELVASATRRPWLTRVRRRSGG